VLRATSFALDRRNCQETVLEEVVRSFGERKGTMGCGDPVSVNLAHPNLPVPSNQ
jgi:hypothetical protein